MLPPGTPTNPNGSPIDPGACIGNVDLGGCTGISYEGESVPLDIYILFDQSGSMLNDVGGLTRLEAVQRATAEFLRAPESAGIGIGIGYFGFQPIGAASCDASEYRVPAVEVTLDHEAVVASLSAREPTGETPTPAALEGACSYAREVKRATPSHGVVILLVTDGVPEAPVTCAGGGCCPVLPDAVRAAADCLASPERIATYVLGVGPALGNLAQIAAAGGTDAAYLVGDVDVTANVLGALNRIRGDASIPCTLEIPPAPSGSTLDYSAVNVVYASSECALEPIYYVESRAACDELGGWHYDDPSNPAQVELCGATCDRVSRPGGSLSFTVGCAAVRPPIR